MLNFISNFWKDDTPRKHVLGFYEKMKPFHEANCRRWYYNLMMQRGNQWSSYVNGILSADFAPTWRVRATFNKLLPLSIMQLRNFLPINPTITVRPANNKSDKDKDKSDKAGRLLHAEWKGKKFKKTLKKMARWMVPCTVGYLLTLWDGRAGQKLEDGAYTGDVLYETPSPFEIIPDYSVDDFDEMPRFLRIKVRSVDYVEWKYGKKVKPGRLNYNSVYQLKAAALSAGIDVDTKNLLENQVLVYDFFELPSVKHPNGFHHICTDKEDLIEPEDLGNNYKLSNGNREYFLGLEAAQSITLPGSLIGTNSIEQTTASQCYYNKGKSEILENIKRTGRPKFIAPKGKIIAGAMVENPAEVIVETNPDVEGVVDVVKPPEMAQYHLQFIAGLPAEMQDMFGVHDATQGVLPRRATSAKAIGFLVGQDDKRATDPKEEIDNAVAGIFSKGLNIAANGYSEKRWKDLIGEDGEVINESLQGEELRNIDVTVVRDTGLPQESAGRMEFAMAILDKKPTKEMVDIVFAIMEADTLADVKAILAGNSEAEETYARMENFDLNKGIDRPVGNHEDHIMHKKIHELLLRNPNILPEVKLLAAEHNKQHDMVAGFEAQEQAGMAPIPGEGLSPDDEGQHPSVGVEQGAGLES